ncbi:MAG: tol-pal system-associated acyl-CoA thioesterase [Gammaproteobacteria bacterium]|tara:strand:+ start:364 stop:774 length:411 start_codon:yes stop_codon:yes gene_type:complete
MLKEFIWKVRVYYEDTDAGGVIFYANYLCFMERARTEWLRKIGFEHKNLITKDKLIFAVKNLTIDYLKPGYLDDLLIIKSKLLNSRGASLIFQQEIKNENDELLTRAEVKIACLNSNTLKASPMPEKLLAELTNDS